MGTRSHPEYTGCVVNHSTAPRGLSLQRHCSSPGSRRIRLLHNSANAGPVVPPARQHRTVLLPSLIARPSRLGALAIAAASLLMAASPAATATELRWAEGAVAAQPGVHQWTWPADGTRVLMRPYIAPATPYGAGHRGIDVGANSEVVYAPADGVVHFAGTVVDRPVLSIRHDGGLLSSFEPVATELHTGDTVEEGQVVGALQSGHCSTPCLHFGVRLDGDYVSPLLYLGGIPHSVLLPTRALR